MKELTVKELYTLDETIAKDIFEGVTYPWEVLPKISRFIVELGNTLSEEEYEKQGGNIWIAKTAKVAKSASITGPAIIGKEAEVRHCAFIRGNAIVGEGAVVGNSTELKNVILFNKVQVPHYNYVGDSILGYKSHMGAASSADLINLFGNLIRLCRNNQDQFTGSHAIHDLIDHDRCHKCRDQTIENCVHISEYRPSKQNNQKIDRHGYKSD